MAAMKRNIGVLLTMVLIVTMLMAQTKPGLSGDSFTGKLTKADDKTKEITLTADVGGQPQTFTGVLEKVKVPMPDGTKKELKPSDFPDGANITVKFKKKQRDEGGKTLDYNQITNVEMSQ
jgi:hypothetical protein